MRRYLSMLVQVGLGRCREIDLCQGKPEASSFRDQLHWSGLSVEGTLSSCWFLVGNIFPIESLYTIFLYSLLSTSKSFLTVSL